MEILTNQLLLSLEINLKIQNLLSIFPLLVFLHSSIQAYIKRVKQTRTNHIN